MAANSYFKDFPIIELFGNRQVNISPKVANNRKLFKSNMLARYTMLPGETAITLAQDFYGNPEYDFIIHIANQVVDPIKDYPLSNKELIEFTTDKYTPEVIYHTHHWEKDGQYFESDPTDGVAVSYIEVEEIKNDLKRNIMILRPEFLSIVLSEFEDIIKPIPDEKFTHSKKLAIKPRLPTQPNVTLGFTLI